MLYSEEISKIFPTKLGKQDFTLKFIELRPIGNSTKGILQFSLWGNPLKFQFFVILSKFSIYSDGIKHR